MQAYMTLTRRELGTHFCSWTGYIVIACVVFLLGFGFNNLILVLNSVPVEQPLTQLFFNTWYFWWIVWITAPVITMRTFAHEKYSGTFETLMTAPVSDLQVVLAKFTGAMLFYTLMLLPLLGCLGIVRYYSHDPSVLDPTTVATTFLGIVLVGCVYISMGCLASSVTRSQIIAAILSFAAGMALALVSFISMILSSQAGWKSQLLSHMALFEHMKDFARGMVDTRPLILYPSLTVLFLFLTYKAIESRRWK